MKQELLIGRQLIKQDLRPSLNLGPGMLEAACFLLASGLC
jgi:hypothetical protein